MSLKKRDPKICDDIERAKVVAKGLGINTYNPLLICGNEGTGKTHLLQAIGNEAKRNNAKLRMIYTTAENFTNEFIEAIRHKKQKEFKNKHRGADFLILDDIKFFEKKKRTQEEFFFTCEHLLNSQKQIVISSTILPRELDFEGKLVSLLQSGYLIKLSLPDFSIRELFFKRCENLPFSIPEEKIDYIVNKTEGYNFFELVGIFNALASGKRIEETLEDFIKEKEIQPINVEGIQKKVTEYFNISLNELKSKERNKSIVLPRQIAMYLCRRLTNFSLPEIGEYFGGKDHTTILYAYKKMEEKIKKDINTKDIINKIISELRAN